MRHVREADRFRMDCYLEEGEFLSSLLEDARNGFAESPPRIPSKYFYDFRGSQLFEQITSLPEYYPTRAERIILETVSREVVQRVRPAELVELGSGASVKTRILLDAVADSGAPWFRYVPFDVDENTVREVAEGLLAAYPRMDVHAVVGDFERHLELLPEPVGRRLVLFLGGTIGNLDPPARHALLSEVARSLRPGDGLLLGVDLVKDRSVLEAAYNDAQGVTAEFNLNMLRVLNRGLRADFDPDGFRHHAFFDPEHERIEMHLVSARDQAVFVRDLHLTLEFPRGSSLWTESSYKFSRESAEAMAGGAGLRMDRWWTDPEERFALMLLERGPEQASQD